MKQRLYINAFFLLSFVPGLLSAQNLVIPSGATIIASSGSIVIGKTWTNNGNFSANSGTVVFSGTTQTIGGSSITAFNNITINTGSTTSITATGQQIKNTLLCNGTLNGNGKLTLLSTATQTAAVDGTGTGEVLGNIIVQRYIASSLGYKYFSSPFQSDTVGDFANDMNLTATFPSFYKHDESLASNGWITYTAGSGVLSPMRGYAANLGASAVAKTVDLQGVVNNHAQSLTLYNHNMAYTQGFNLVGNPYPSPVSWDAASGWTKTNIDNAIYFFNAGTTNQYTGVYSSYVNGVSSDGVAGPTIAAMQGFFVHVSNGGYPVTGLLAVTNSARTLNSTATFYRMTGAQEKYPLMRLSASYADAGGIADLTTIYFTDEAKIKFTKELDALKLMNTDSLIPNLFVVSAAGEKLSIRSLKNQADTMSTVALALTIKKDGWISFKARDMESYPVGTAVYLLDKNTGISQDLQKDSVYRIFLPAADYYNRFYLQFGHATTTTTTVSSSNTSALAAYWNGSSLMVNPGLDNGTPGQLIIMNEAGQVIDKTDISGNQYQAIPAHVAAGVYVLQLYAGGKLQSKKIFIGGN